MNRDDTQFRSLAGKNVTSSRSWMQEFRAFVESNRMGKCDVHWGRHSCNHDSGHKRRIHHCQCGAIPEYSSVLWGIDLDEQEIAEQSLRQKRLAKRENIASWADQFDQYGNYNPDRKRRGISDEQGKKLVA
jgi:hypothetical protein